MTRMEKRDCSKEQGQTLEKSDYLWVGSMFPQRGFGLGTFGRGLKGRGCPRLRAGRDTLHAWVGANGGRPGCVEISPSFCQKKRGKLFRGLSKEE